MGDDRPPPPGPAVESDWSYVGGETARRSLPTAKHGLERGRGPRPCPSPEGAPEGGLRPTRPWAGPGGPRIATGSRFVAPGIPLRPGRRVYHRDALGGGAAEVTSGLTRGKTAPRPGAPEVQFGKHVVEQKDRYQFDRDPLPPDGSPPRRQEPDRVAPPGTPGSGRRGRQQQTTSSRCGRPCDVLGARRRPGWRPTPRAAPPSRPLGADVGGAAVLPGLSGQRRKPDPPAARSLHQGPRAATSDRCRLAETLVPHVEAGHDLGRGPPPACRRSAGRVGQDPLRFSWTPWRPRDP